jgi:hypothetical protein
MPSSFLYNALTLDGMQLVARATAANKLIITGTKSCTLAASSLADLASKPLSWYDGKTGTIQAVSAIGTTARIVARYTNSGVSQIAKSFCITAKIEGDVVDVILAALSDPDASIVLPGISDLSQKIDIPFPISITANDTIEVTPDSSASIADLDRFVSMYSAADSSVGEAQTILGEKTFEDDAVFSKGVQAQSAAVTDGLLVGGGITGGGDLSIGGSASVGSTTITGDLSLSTSWTSSHAGSVQMSVTRGADSNISFTLRNGPTVSQRGILLRFLTTNPVYGDSTVDWTLTEQKLSCASAGEAKGEIDVWGITAASATLGALNSFAPVSSGVIPDWICTPKIGGIIPAFLKYDAVTANDAINGWEVGKSFTLGDGDAHVAHCDSSGALAAAGQLALAAGTYVALTGCTAPRTTAGYTNCVWLQRIA